MAAMNHRAVTVFGGTGFLGRRVVQHLRNGKFSVRIASRYPEQGKELFGSDRPQLQSVEANIHDERSIADALAGAYSVVNEVSLYVEHGRETFHSVHGESARRLATQAHRAGVERLAHVSGIGSDPASPSLYIRRRGEGELAVRAAFAEAARSPSRLFGDAAHRRDIDLAALVGGGDDRLAPQERSAQLRNPDDSANLPLTFRASIQNLAFATANRFSIIAVTCPCRRGR